MDLVNLNNIVKHYTLSKHKHNLTNRVQVSKHRLSTTEFCFVLSISMVQVIEYMYIDSLWSKSQANNNKDYKV